MWVCPSFMRKCAATRLHSTAAAHRRQIEKAIHDSFSSIRCYPRSISRYGGPFSHLLLRCSSTDRRDVGALAVTPASILPGCQTSVAGRGPDFGPKRNSRMASGGRVPVLSDENDDYVESVNPSRKGRRNVDDAPRGIHDAENEMSCSGSGDSFSSGQPVTCELDLASVLSTAPSATTELQTSARSEPAPADASSGSGAHARRGTHQALPAAPSGAGGFLPCGVGMVTHASILTLERRPYAAGWPNARGDDLRQPPSDSRKSHARRAVACMLIWPRRKATVLFAGSGSEQESGRRLRRAHRDCATACPSVAGK